MNIVTKNGGIKHEKNFFPETRRFRKQTTMEKNPQEKLRKHVFINTRISSSKNRGKKTRENFFSRNTQFSQANNDGKKSSGKSAKTRIL